MRYANPFILFVTLFFVSAAHADEGMWAYNSLPKKILKEKYGFEVTDAWGEHLMKASARFFYVNGGGGSGSFISSDGLVLTNHHVAAHALDTISDKDHEYRNIEFLAKSHEEELPVKNLEIHSLVGIEDVTKQVEAAVAGLDPAGAVLARRAVIGKIEKETFDKTGLKAQVVTLYQGGQYHLYTYKRYEDVRLVFAPEHKIAFFGGDPDNFEYPRYDLDMTYFRVYENGKPAKIDHFLEVATEGVKENDLVFVSGHPGKTNRLLTVDALKFLRDEGFPYTLAKLRHREINLQQFSIRSDEQKRQAEDSLFSVQNSRKAFLGKLEGLQTNALIKQREKEEQAFKRGVAAHPGLKEYAGAWDRLSESVKAERVLYKEKDLLEDNGAFNSKLYALARHLVRLAAEDAKPNSDRLEDYRDSNRATLTLSLLSTAPIYPELEVATLADSLSFFAEQLSYPNPNVQLVLDGKSPREIARNVVAGTKLADVEYRRRLIKGGASAIAHSTDPMIVLARNVDPFARAIRKKYENQVSEIQKQAYSQIAKAKLGLYGSDSYPDATFTLRLSFGQVKGYKEGSKKIAPWTTLGGAFEHSEAHKNIDPWELPQSWTKAKGSLDLSTPFNFVSTADIIGGNSGSPVVNTKGQFVGIIFDGNLQSLTGDYVYTDLEARSLAVDNRGIQEAMRKIYCADSLVDSVGK